FSFFDFFVVVFFSVFSPAPSVFSVFFSVFSALVSPPSVFVFFVVFSVFSAFGAASCFGPARTAAGNATTSPNVRARMNEFFIVFLLSGRVDLQQTCQSAREIIVQSWAIGGRESISREANRLSWRACVASRLTMPALRAGYRRPLRR